LYYPSLESGVMICLTSHFQKISRHHKLVIMGYVFILDLIAVEDKVFWSAKTARSFSPSPCSSSERYIYTFICSASF
jgi:hypothetical protein